MRTYDNLIEAINQPWKRLSEGTVGGYWGMLDTGLQPKFPLQGPMQERKSALPYLLAALLGAFACGALGLQAGKRSWRWLTWTVAGDTTVPMVVCTMSTSLFTASAVRTGAGGGACGLAGKR